MSDLNANKRLKIEAHDASRVEWSVYIALPKGKETNEADVDLRLEFPENVYAAHDGWEQLQILARLSSPDEDAASTEPITFDGVRRAALGVARRMKLLRDWRRFQLAASRFIAGPMRPRICAIAACFACASCSWVSHFPESAVCPQNGQNRDPGCTGCPHAGLTEPAAPAIVTAG